MESFTAQELPDYRNYIREEFLKRLSKNPQYSLRAFAKNLGLAPSRVSLILNHRQGLSKGMAISIGKKLGFDNHFLQYFALLAEARHARSRTQRENAIKKLTKKKKESSRYVSLSQDAFQVISDWWHIAILQLGAIADFDGQITTIAKRLNLDLNLTKLAVERLARLNLLRIENDRVQIITSNITTTPNIPSTAIRSFHEQVLEKAQDAIQNQNINERNLSALVVPMDIKKYQSVVSLIDELNEKVYDETQSHQKKTDVYCLGIQFFKFTNNKETL